MAAPPAAAPASPRGGSRKRALDPEQVSAFIAKVLETASEPALQEEARKLQKKQEQFSFSVLSKDKAYTLETIGLKGLVPLDIPPLPEPRKEPSPWLTEAVALVRRYWHVSSSENTTRTLIDVILLGTMKQLPEDKKLNVWGEVSMPQHEASNVYSAADYVLGPPSLEHTPVKGRYVIVVAAKKALDDQDRVQAFAEMKYALEKNNDGLTVYGVLTDALQWCILSLRTDWVPRISAPLYLTAQPKYAEGQLEDLVNTLYAVFLLAVTPTKGKSE